MAARMDLSFLRVLYDRPGPFASVYLDMRRTEAPRGVEVRRHVRCKELADQGAPPATIQAVERVIAHQKEQREYGCLAVFACGGDVAFSALLDGPPRAELARYAPLPHVVPLLEQRGEPVSRLVAVVNRLGAHLRCVAVDGTRWEAEVPPTAHFPVHKPKGGDMLSQPRIQRAAEDRWRTNARNVARVIEQAVGACGFEVVVVAGDVRTRAAVLEELSDPVLARTVESRSGGPSLDEDVADIVARARTRRMTAAVDRFNEQLGKGRRAVDGLDAVARALRNGQVASLLIDDRSPPGGPGSGGPYEAGSRDSADRRPSVSGQVGNATVWTGPGCTDVGTSPGELRERGVTDLVQDRADAAMIRALAGTDGELLLITLGGWHADHGVGALLRYTDAPVATPP
jgi:Bacterial archaeo-eukaryotic release factor family 2